MINWKNVTRVAFLAALLGMAAGCVPSERRVREIVKEELTAALQKTVHRDATVIGPYSPAQQVGGFLFVSGQIAIDQQSGNLLGDDIETETRQALVNLMAILHRAGYDSSDVVSTTVFLKDIADYGKMNNIYGGYFQDGDYPARSTVEVAGLPRGARVEIAAVAYRPR